MTDYRSLNHTRWTCQYHVVFIPKYRKKVIYGELRPHLGEVLRRLAQRRECEVEEGHLMVDHMHLMLSIPPKYESPDIKVGRSQRTGSTCAVSPAHLSSSNNHRLNALRRLLAAAEQAPQPERGLRRRPSTEARKYCSGRSQKNP